MSFFHDLIDRTQEVIGRIDDAIDHIPQAIERIPEVLSRADATVDGFINPNYRHDDPVEKQNDKIRAEINASHRFQSFANQRSNNFVKWHIDGHDYFWAVSELLESAREAIFILDWWLSPELYLRRPCEYYQEYRLDRLLKRKAEQGVKIYVVVYKEVTQTMNMSSAHTKHELESLHPNIVVMRHPDHIGTKDIVEFWSHHEKVVVVDNHAACIGGLDLCFGRWDTHSHPLADVHPTEFGRTLFPGQDYNNARVLDFQEVNNFVGNTVSTLETPRMPWHDVHMSLIGPAVLDIVQHFVERWNFVKKLKYNDVERYQWLAFPHAIEAAPNEAIVRHPHREAFRKVGHRFRQHFYGREAEDSRDHYHGPAPHGSCRVQVVRSVCDWSHGVLKECSVQTAYCQLIQESRHFIYIENQFFISNTQDKGVISNRIAQALVERIIRAAREGYKFKVIVIIPEVPAFSGDVTDVTAIHTILAAQYRTINRGGHSIYEEIRKAGYNPEDYIKFYNLRAYDRINAPWDSYLKKVQETSNVDFYQAQVAQDRQWIGDMWGTNSSKEVKIAEIQTNAGLGIMDQDAKKEDVKTVTIPMLENLQDAVALVEKWEAAALQVRGDGDVSDTVGQHAMQDKSALSEEKWLGTEEEERFAYVSELLYIHGKVMIVDDRRVIMGSANINDRSQKGDGDSEIALVVEDDDVIDTTMDGQDYQAGRFAATLRRKLWREHLGLMEPQNCQERDEKITTFMRPAPILNKDETGLEEDRIVADPLSDQALGLWQDTAKVNRDVFTELFRPVPTNLVQNKEQYKNYLPKVKTGHVVPDIPLARVKDRLSQVRGHLVECPIDFMKLDEDFVEGADWMGLNPTLPIYI